jgi:hypothetical protein
VFEREKLNFYGGFGFESRGETEWEIFRILIWTDKGFWRSPELLTKKRAGNAKEVQGKRVLPFFHFRPWTLFHFKV